MHLMGLSPFEFGEKVATNAITIRDTVVDGVWGALAYDAEGRPTTPTTVVRDGELVALLHDTATAVEFGQRPAGNAIPSLDYDHPPRIHARHLDVEAGETEHSDLLISSDIAVTRFGPAQYVDEVEKTGREGWMPASSLYATEIADHSPDPDQVGHLRLPIAEGTALNNREQLEPSGYAVEISPETLMSVTGLSKGRETVGYVCSKHKSSIPCAVSAPSLQLRSTVLRR
jgi:TldD protein